MTLEVQIKCSICQKKITPEAQRLEHFLGIKDVRVNMEVGINSIIEHNPECLISIAFEKWLQEQEVNQ